MQAIERDFATVYDAHFAFVWRSVRRLGINESAVDDVVQDVFLVVHRRLPDFEGRSSLKTWLYGIVLRVVRTHRRTVMRKRRVGAGSGGDLEALPSEQLDPSAASERGEAVRLLHALLDELDDEKREVFVLAELEQLTAPEIAEAVGLKLNTVYSRLRAARSAFNRSVERHRARVRSATEQAQVAGRGQATAGGRTGRVK